MAAPSKKYSIDTVTLSALTHVDSVQLLKVILVRAPLVCDMSKNAPELAAACPINVMPIYVVAPSPLQGFAVCDICAAIHCSAGTSQQCPKRGNDAGERSINTHKRVQFPRAPCSRDVCHPASRTCLSLLVCNQTTAGRWMRQTYRTQSVRIPSTSRLLQAITESVRSHGRSATGIGVHNPRTSLRSLRHLTPNLFSA